MNLKEKLGKIKSDKPSEWMVEAGAQIANSRVRKNARKVALRVLHILQEKEISQTDLAKKMGVSRQQITKIVSGKENFTFDTIDKLEKALDVTLITISTSEAEAPLDFTGMSAVVPVPVYNAIGEINNLTNFSDPIYHFHPVPLFTKLTNRLKTGLDMIVDLRDPAVKAAWAIGTASRGNYFSTNELNFILYYKMGTLEEFKDSDPELSEFTMS